MNPSGEGLPVIYLKPGEMHISETPSIIVTVLGSCLSVTLFHRGSRLGAICHGLFPECAGKKTCNSGCVDEFKFVDCSIKKMLALFDERHIQRREIEVKYFGGADIFSIRPRTTSIVSVGRQNIASAKKMLENEGLTLHATDVGGRLGRKILFYTHTGGVLLKRLQVDDASNVMSAP
jgi:chemotaxis protein CheD